MSDNRRTYCLHCNAESVSDIFVEGLQKFHCLTCDHIDERALIIDPAIRWWQDETGEYWHETAGVFLYNTQGEFLFFSRIKSPYGLTVPAGHVDRGENTLSAALREIGEEVGIHLDNAQYSMTCDIYGDKCRRGANIHRWHVFTAPVPSSHQIVMNNEGVRPMWLTLNQALHHNPTFAIRYLITHYSDLL